MTYALAIHNYYPINSALWNYIVTNAGMAGGDMYAVDEENHERLIQNKSDGIIMSEPVEILVGGERTRDERQFPSHLSPSSRFCTQYGGLEYMKGTD